MPTLNPEIKSALITLHPRQQGLTEQVEAIQSFLQELGVNACVHKTNDTQLPARIAAHDFDLVIAMGGDGTMLRAGLLSAPHGIPLLGINMGRFGFLMQVAREDWQNCLPRIVKGDYKIESRMMLQADHHRGDALLDSFQVMNEVVVCRGQMVRPIRINASVDGYPLASYVADGLIAATPTGSTAYALAVGGPIMPPELHNILIVPVAPHLSMDRAIILPAGACVSISVKSDHQAVMSLDGRNPILLTEADKVVITASDFHVNFIVFEDPGYFYRNLNQYMNQNPSSGSLK